MLKIQPQSLSDQLELQLKPDQAAEMGGSAADQRERKKLYNERYRKIHKSELLKKSRDTYRASHPNWDKSRPKNTPITKEYILKRVIVDESTGCWNWQKCKTNRGYGNAAENGKNVVISRRAYELWVGPIPDGLEACHRCDNPPCCNPDHLFAGTGLQNMEDASVKGRLNISKRKLSTEQIYQIRADQRAQKLIAKDFGVQQNCISKIKTGKTYFWVK